MNDVAIKAIDRFELVLRWIYPGLLFWAFLPLAVHISCEPICTVQTIYSSFYATFSAPVQLALIITAGFVIYVVERYFVQEGILLALILFPFDVGAAANFKNTGTKWYPSANAKLLWVRFGHRPNDGEESGERAEN